jgi:hypothetical protein
MSVYLKSLRLETTTTKNRISLSLIHIRSIFKKERGERRKNFFLQQTRKIEEIKE